MLPSNVTILPDIWAWRILTWHQWFQVAWLHYLADGVCLPLQIDQNVDSGLSHGHSLMFMTFLPTEKRIIISQSLIKVWVHNCSGQEKHWVFFNLMKMSGVTEFRTWRYALRLESEHTLQRGHEKSVKNVLLAERASFLSLQTSLLACCLFWEEMSKLLRNCQTLHTAMHSVHLDSSTFWYSLIWEMCILARKTI